MQAVFPAVQIPAMRPHLMGSVKAGSVYSTAGSAATATSHFAARPMRRTIL
jgi:hypothetical protein